MLFACISRPELLKNLEGVDGVELRLDLFPILDLKQIKQILDQYSCILTLRRASQSEGEREKKIIELLQLNPPFFDLEWDMRETFLIDVIAKYSKTKFILSYHNFEQTPDDLDGIYRAMVRFPTFGYKIAAMSLSTNDALRMLLLSKKHPNLSTICMGEKGEFARVLGPVFGNQIDYGAVNNQEKVAPGQLCLHDLLTIYRYRSLEKKTALYGLIGDPVDKSQGHIYHNDLFRDKKTNALYVKMGLCPEEISTFFPLAREIGFRGLSVTMPLKEAIVSHIDKPDRNVLGCKASNTLLLKEGCVFGTNTDGVGALDAIEKRGSVDGKKVVIIGAGGASRAIAFEAKKRGAEVWIVNRTKEKGRILAEDLECKFGFPSFYDILACCTPSNLEIDQKWILEGALVMDITYAPKETPFLLAAKAKGCEIIYGEEMFINQAKLQTKFWF